jgi:hypothetical protein
MNTIFKLCTALFIILIILGGCGFSAAQEKEMVETATPLGVEYIKKYYNADFVLNDYEIIDPAITTTIFLHGYIKGHKDEPISISYDYTKKKLAVQRVPVGSSIAGIRERTFTHPNGMI